MKAAHAPLDGASTGNPGISPWWQKKVSLYRVFPQAV
jgi:hypothetical protein